LNSGPWACWSGNLPLEPHYHPFVILVVWIGPHIYYQASLDCNPPINTSHVAGMTGTCHHTQLFIGWGGVSLTFPPDCLLTCWFSLFLPLEQLGLQAWATASSLSCSFRELKVTLNESSELHTHSCIPKARASKEIL
jgi:hypothetical protein